MTEALFVLPSLVLVISTGIFLSYLTFANFWLKFRLYESLICVAETYQIQKCENESRKIIQRLLPIGKVQQFQLQENQSKIFGQIHFQITPNFSVRKKTSLARDAIHANARCCD